MTKAPMNEPAHYFDRAYRDYELQNPERKLDHYLDRIDARTDSGPKDLLDIGCGLGSFLAQGSTPASELGLFWHRHRNGGDLPNRTSVA